MRFTNDLLRNMNLKIIFRVEIDYFIMLISLAQAQIFFLTLTRVLIIMIQIPIFSSRNVPSQYKIAFGVLLTMIILPWNETVDEEAALALLPFAFAIFRELIVGLLIGFAATMTFGVFQIAAKIMELGSGFSAGQVFNPTIGDIGSAFDQLFIMVIMLIFLISNGHHVFILGIRKTFEILPVLSPFPEFSLVILVKYFSSFFAIGIQLAMPVFGAILLADLSLGLLAKVAPQIQVFFLGLPIKVGLGLLGLYLSLQVLVPLASELVKEIGEKMLGLVGA